MSKFLSNALLNTALAAALVVSAPAALLAQTTTPAKTEKSDKTMSKSDAKSTTGDKMKAAKPLTAQQQKMKDCGAKWQEEKKTKGVSGKAAYQKFLGTCLKA